MSEAQVPAGSAAEAWLREAFDRLVHELRLFGRTFSAFLVRPGRSARAWQTGERVFMNPLAFGATAAGAYLAVASALAALWPVPGPDAGATLSDQITSAVGPYVHYGLLGAAMHLGLRTLGSRHRILGSIGTAFFAGGSIGTLTALLLTATTRRVAHVRGTNSLELGSGDAMPLVILVLALIAYALVCLIMARALMALHRTAAWKVIIAGVFAVVVTALLFGSVLPDGAYGWHPYIRLERNFSLGVGFRG